MPQVIAVLQALGHDEMVARVRGYDEDTVQEVIDFLKPLAGKGDVAASNLTALRKHLRHSDEDVDMVKQMKQAVKDYDYILDVLGVIKSCKETVTYLKQSGLSSRLSKKVLQECETRWNSVHTMLKSVLEVYDEVRPFF